MIFSLSTRQCIELMDIASRFVAKNTTLPILSNIYMQVVWQDLIIKSTDMEKFVHITLPLVGECAEGAITVDAKTLFEILRVLDEENLSIKANLATCQITISTARDTFTIKGIDAAEFAVLPEITSDGEITLAATDFSSWIAAVEYTVLEKNFTPIFTWIALKTKTMSDHNKLVFVWTDSFRLAEYTVRLDASLPLDEVTKVIPKTAASDMKKIADYTVWQDPATTMKIMYAKNMICATWTMGEIHIVANTLIIQWQFPDYDNEKVMPTNFTSTVTVDAPSMEKAIRKVNIITKEKNNYVRFSAHDATMDVDSWTIVTDSDVRTSLSAIIQWPHLTIGCNGKHCSEYIKYTWTDRLFMHFVDENAPIVLTTPHDTAYRYVIRPLKN